MRSGSAGHGFSRQAGFSLIELLTVLAIIAILAGILIPTLNNARNSAKKGATLTLMSGLANAASQFQLDKRRLPGYFSQRLMGNTQNRDTYGFTNVENMILDLAGGIVTTAEQTGLDVSKSPADGGPAVLKVGPALATAGGSVNVDITRLGTATQSATGTVDAGYFKPDGKYFQPQSRNIGSRLGRVGDPTGEPTALAMPTVVDAFGQPILAWIQDDAAPGNSAFAAEHSGAPGTSNIPSAKFYWSSNAGFLKATNLGKRGEDQTRNSILTRSTAPSRAKTVEAICGNPAHPDPSDPSRPIAARAPLVLHSAGPGGAFLSRTTRGGKTAAAAAGLSIETDNDLFVPFKANRDWMTEGSFDDIITTAGN